MKLNELQLGDWVSYNPHGFGSCYAQVFEIMEDCLRVQAEALADENNDGIELAFLNEIERVPCTATILKENGFKLGYFTAHDNDGDKKAVQLKTWVWNNVDNSISIDLPTVQSGCVVTINKGNERIITIDIPNAIAVHELQHLIRLADIDKQISLTD